MKYRSLQDCTTHDLVVIHWAARVDRAFDIMTGAGVRHLPVVDDDLAVVGVISERDFHRAMQDGELKFDADARVSEFMSWPVEAIEEKKSIADAARLMIDKKISSLVVTREKRIVGIVTTEDLLKVLLEGSQHGKLEELKIGFQAAVYQSPIGQIAHALANAGI